MHKFCRPSPGASLLVCALNPLPAHPSPCFSKSHTWRLCCKAKDSSGARACEHHMGVQLVTRIPFVRRPVLIFLHSRLHQDAQEFILNALTRPEFVEVRAMRILAVFAAPHQACCLLAVCLGELHCLGWLRSGTRRVRRSGPFRRLRCVVAGCAGRSSAALHGALCCASAGFPFLGLYSITPDSTPSRRTYGRLWSHEGCSPVQEVRARDGA